MKNSNHQLIIHQKAGVATAFSALLHRRLCADSDVEGDGGLSVQSPSS